MYRLEPLLRCPQRSKALSLRLGRLLGLDAAVGSSHRCGCSPRSVLQRVRLDHLLELFVAVGSSRLCGCPPLSKTLILRLGRNERRCLPRTYRLHILVSNTTKAASQKRMML